MTPNARCFRAGPIDSYYPLFWFTNSDKARYKELFDIRHSACYELWGFKRTGCIGCPYGRRFEQELQISQMHEPGVVSVARKVFADSYDYMRKYLAYKSERTTGQMRILI